MRLPDALENSALLQGNSAWRRGLEKPVLVFADVVAFALAILAWHPALVNEVESLRFPPLSARHIVSDQLFIFLLLVTLSVGIFWLRGHYSRRIPFWHEVRQIIKYVALLALLYMSVMHFSEVTEPRASSALTWLAAPLLIVALRLLVKRTFYQLGGWVRPAIIIGTGANAIDCARAVESESLMGLQVAAFVTPDEATHVSSVLHYSDRTYPVLPLAEALDWLREDKTQYPQVFVALDTGQLQQNIGLVGKLSRLTQHTYVVPAFRGLPLVGLETSHFFGQDVAVLWVPNNLARRGPQLIKRLFDVVLSAVLLAVLAPLLLVLSYKVSRGGPVLFVHHRVGLRGQPFACYKFRTMVPDADKLLEKVLSDSAIFKAEWEKDFKLRQDPRVTRIGAWLRRTSLDELPQLWNVLKGDMSLVGPRPIVQKELERYGEHADYYREVRPGITGLWQISGRNDVDYSDRVQLDTWYVRNWSLWYDVVILLRTVGAVTKRNGAY